MLISEIWWNAPFHSPVAGFPFPELEASQPEKALQFLTQMDSTVSRICSHEAVINIEGF